MFKRFIYMWLLVCFYMALFFGFVAAVAGGTALIASLLSTFISPEITVVILALGALAGLITLVIVDNDS